MAYNRINQESRDDRDALILKRLNEGFSPSVLATRMGITYDDIKNGRNRRMADLKKKEDKDVTEKLELLRGLIRSMKGGLQSHQAQDLQREMIVALDDIEAEIR